MPRLSLGLGVQSVSKVKSGGAAPSGIVVATTNSILVTGGDYLNGVYIKVGGEYVGDSYNITFNLSYDPDQWVIYQIEGDTFFCVPPATNPSIIPNNWGGGLTLTAIA
jgi:hypothetical protein